MGVRGFQPQRGGGGNPKGGAQGAEAHHSNLSFKFISTKLVHSRAVTDYRGCTEYDYQSTLFDEREKQRAMGTIWLLGEANMRGQCKRT